MTCAEHNWKIHYAIVKAPSQQWGGEPVHWRVCKNCGVPQEQASHCIEDTEDFSSMCNKGFMLLDARINLEINNDDGVDASLVGWVQIDGERLAYLENLQANAYQATLEQQLAGEVNKVSNSIITLQKYGILDEDFYIDDIQQFVKSYAEKQKVSHSTFTLPPLGHNGPSI